MAEPLLSRSERADRTVEISFEVPGDEVAVLDGYCQAKRLKRGTVLRSILRDWSAARHHEAIMIVRVAGNNPPGSGQSPDMDGGVVYGSEQTARG